MRRLPFSIALLAVVAAMLLLAVLASAREPGPNRWPGPVVRVADRSGWDAVVRRAVDQWNAADVGIRFVLVDRADRADVRVVSDPARLGRYCRSRGCEAFSSTVGPSDRHRTDVVLGRPLGSERTRATASDVRLLVHELGHTIGLRHARDERCAVMRPDVALSGCGDRGGASGDGPALCGPFADDVGKAARIYGGAGIARPLCLGGWAPPR